jgi:hypothetical protein
VSGVAFVDRVEQLRLSTSMTGIDFVQVGAFQTELTVFLQHDILPAALEAVLTALSPAAFIIKAVGAVLPLQVITTQHVLPIPTPDGRHALRLQVAQSGGFGYYTLHINSSAIDPYYNDVVFSFKANCDSKFDCAAPARCCPAEDSNDYAVDYRGRDFWSLRQTLLDFASQRYPAWQDRLEADVGAMAAELLAALGDEFSYAQDRIAAEFNLETATQRRSLRHLARLVDYALDEGCGAGTWLDVEAKLAGPLAAGTAVCDVNAQVFFELGHGLRDLGTNFAIHPARNAMLPYLWDENNICLPIGSTELSLQGHLATVLVPIDVAIDPVGRWVLLATQTKAMPSDPSQPERRVLVRIVEAHDDTDLLLGAPITRIRWDAPTTVALDMLTLVVRGNLLPATSGRTGPPLRFRVGPKLTAADPDATVIERVGVNSALAYSAGDDGHVKFLFPLPDSEATPLTWLEYQGGMAPEVRLEREGDGPWDWLPSLVGEDSAKPTSKVYTLEDGVYRRVAGYERFGKLTELVDYASSEGKTLRFGDGEFGLAPTDGSKFKLLYRLGNGGLMNTAKDTLTRFADATPAIVKSVTNPLAASGGRDPESASSVRTNAPEAYQALTYRAVKPQDYVDVAERLPWMQRAGASTRWTGSWPTIFVTPDPRDTVGLPAAQRLELEQLMDRVRQAARQVKVMDPRYADIELRICVCVEPNAYRGEVKKRVLEALFGRPCNTGEHVFFDEDNFSFGTPLSRAEMIAAIQAVAGVRAVEGMQVRRRGWFDWREFNEFSLGVGMTEVIRVTNNRAFAEYGAVELTMEGGL